MTYWTDDRLLDLEQRRLDAAQAEAKAGMCRAEEARLIEREPSKNPEPPE